MLTRCINIDWLEIFALEERNPCDAAYFRLAGYEVKARDYGTPMYAEMFTIYDADFPLYEVRRSPLSVKSQGGIFPDNMCHIRLVNRTCYMPGCVNHLRAFLLRHGYRYKGLSRVDICNDFEKFDQGDNPQNVISSYMKGKISKINQCRVAAHGRDTFAARNWNSLKWGSESSAVSTKLYNKTMELNTEGHEKLWIRDAWKACGIADVQWCFADKDDAGNPSRRYKPVTVRCGTAVPDAIPIEQADPIQIYRVEFSIKTEGKRYVKTDTGELFEVDLGSIDTPSKLLFFFHVLANHYFHFKTVVLNANGKVQRKDRCPDKVLFRTGIEQQGYHPVPVTTDRSPSRTLKLLAKLLMNIANDTTEVYDREQRACAHKLYSKLMYEASRHKVKKFSDFEDIDTYFYRLFGDQADQAKHLLL